MTTVLIFDIDGTLTNTRFIDETSYNYALKKVFNLELLPAERSKFNGSADSGFLYEICKGYLGREATEAEIVSFKNTFTQSLEQKLQHQQKLLINGAKQLLTELKQNEHFTIAMATGAWFESAKLKLKYANVDYVDIELTTGSEGRYKLDILKLAFHKIKKRGTTFKKAFYIGDRHWDYLAAKSLNVKFIGVGSDELLLQHVDKSLILDDLSHTKRFIELVNNE